MCVLSALCSSKVIQLLLVCVSPACVYPCSSHPVSICTVYLAYNFTATTVFDRLIAVATVISVRQTLQLLSEGGYYGLVWQQPVAFIRIHE